MKLRIGFCLVLGFVIGLAGVFWVSDAVAAPRVMIVHSYEQGHVCGQPQHDGVVAALNKEGYVVPEDLEIDTFYMDTKRRNNTRDLILEQAGRVMEKIERNPPDVLVTLDDNAFRTVGLEMTDSGIPVVFCGMNGQPEDYHRQKPFLNTRSRPGHNITGVYEKLHIVDAFRVHSRLFPNVGRIRILLDTSPTGRAIGRQIELELDEAPPSVSWDVRTVTGWDAYQEEILQANRDEEIGALYLATLLLKTASGKTYTAPEIFQWTVKQSTKPEIAVNYAFTRLGLFGGAAVDFHAMGEQAGRMVVRILQGEQAGSLSIEEAKKYALAFNIQRARQLGLSIPNDILMAADEVVDSIP